jgi:RHS repeat-associated protein
MGRHTYETDYQYDSLGRMTGEVISAGGEGLASRSLAYDSAGNRLSQEVDAPAVAGIEHRIDYDYDPLDRVRTVASRGQTAGYDYDLSGNLVRMSYPNRIESRRVYDQANRLTELRNVRLPSQAALNYFKYGYDKMNNRVSMREVTGLHQYGYDKLYRLTTVDYPRYPDQAYSYDPSGNRLTLAITGKDTQTYTYNPANSLKDVTEGQKQTTYEWDKAGNLKAKGESAGGKTEYVFDGANRLSGATLPSGQSLTYGYDTDGHRVYRKEGDEKTWFVFDGLSVVMELDKDRKASAAIVPGLSKTNLSYHIPVTEYYLYDGLGSVVQLTDYWGNLTQEYWYEPFGELQKVVKDPNNRSRFVGLAGDDNLGLVYMNARWYESSVGRFISRDPVEGNARESQALNTYSYAMNRPVEYTDKTGLAAGDAYIDRDIAACAAIDEIEIISLKENVEYGGWILGGEDNSFSYTDAFTSGLPSSIAPGSPPAGAVAFYHIHQGCERSSSGIFSPEDALWTGVQNRGLYLGTSLGLVKYLSGVVGEGEVDIRSSFRTGDDCKALKGE